MDQKLEGKRINAMNNILTHNFNHHMTVGQSEEASNQSRSHFGSPSQASQVAPGWEAEVSLWIESKNVGEEYIVSNIAILSSSHYMSLSLTPTFWPFRK